jgi:uncharacterized protein YjbI with pentapeptide repeats
MANDEHVALLKRGVDAWNAWRDKNPNIPADLSGAYFRDANLPRANLRGANLSEAFFPEASLRGADLGLCCLDAGFSPPWPC